MCVIQRSTLVHPNGFRERRDRLFHCERGTPHTPCNYTRVEQLGEFRVEHPRPQVPDPPPAIPIIEPRSREHSPQPERRKERKEIPRSFRYLVKSFFSSSSKKKMDKPKRRKMVWVRYKDKEKCDRQPRSRTTRWHVRELSPQRPPPQRPPPQHTNQEEPLIIPIQPQAYVHQDPQPYQANPNIIYPQRPARSPYNVQRSNSYRSPEQIRQEEERKSLLEAHERARHAERIALDAQRRAQDEARRRQWAQNDAENIRRQRDEQIRRNAELENVRRSFERDRADRIQQREHERRQQRRREDAARQERAERAEQVRRLEEENHREAERRAAYERERRKQDERERIGRQRQAGIARERRHTPAVHQDYRADFEAQGDRVIHRDMRAYRGGSPRGGTPPRRRHVGGGLWRRDTIATGERRIYDDYDDERARRRR